MKPFRIQSMRVEKPPDGMLVGVSVRSGLLVVQFHQRFFTEGMLHDFDEWNRHATRNQLYMQEDDGTLIYTGGTHLLTGAEMFEEGTYGAHMEHVSDKVLPLSPMSISMQGPHELVYLIREDAMRSELIRDYNEVVGSMRVKCKIWRRM